MDQTTELLKIAAQLGVGGLLAAFMFIVAWRYVTHQVQETKEDKKILIDLVSGITTVITKNTSASEDHTTVVRDMQASLQEIKRTTENNTVALNELRRELAGRRENWNARNTRG